MLRDPERPVAKLMAMMLRPIEFSIACFSTANIQSI